MQKLTDMHDEFIRKAQCPLVQRPPVRVSEPEVPVIALERWHEVAGSLTKRYEFRHPAMRPAFVVALMEYEAETQHHAVLIVDEGAVIVKLVTKNIDRITELDREYARYADVVFKDLVYSL